jgi:hypothetical protein
MANMYRPSIREVSLPDGQYVPANNQGGFPAQWPVCTPAIDVWWLAMYVCICQCMYGIGQSGSWNQSEIDFWKSFFPFFDFFY